MYLSVILVQPFRLSNSMFLQFCEKVLQRKKNIYAMVIKLNLQVWSFYRV